MIINVEFEEEALRHYCAKNLPDISNVLRLDHLICAINFLSEEPCLLCDSFQNSIREAIMRQARNRLTNIPLIEDA